MFAASQRCVSSEPQLKAGVLGHARARGGADRVGVLRVVTLEQIAVGDVVEEVRSRRTDERAIAVRAHERDAREHRTVAPVGGAARWVEIDRRRNVDRRRPPGPPRGCRAFAARQAIRQVSGCVQEVPGLGTRMWFEKKKGAHAAMGAAHWRARGGTSSDAVQLTLHAAPSRSFHPGERMRVIVRVVRVRGAIAGECVLLTPDYARRRTG